jgi:hypothetical protein
MMAPVRDVGAYQGPAFAHWWISVSAIGMALVKAGTPPRMMDFT